MSHNQKNLFGLLYLIGI